MSFSD